MWLCQYPGLTCSWGRKSQTAVAVILGVVQRLFGLAPDPIRVLGNDPGEQVFGVLAVDGSLTSLSRLLWGVDADEEQREN